MKTPHVIRFRLPSDCAPRSGVDASVQFTAAFARAALLLGLIAAACSVDGKGLAGQDGGGIGGGSGGLATGGDRSTGSGGASSGGAPGTGGVPASGSGGQVSGGTGGGIGSGGGMVEPATGGVPGSGGAPGTGGTASGGAAQPGSGGAGTGGAASGGRGTGGAATGGANTGGAPMPACDAVTCPDGCCMGTTCVTNRTDQRCGTGGVQCAACGACFQCSNAGTCTVDSNARWDLICASATLANTKGGQSWDPATPETPLPDPYCRLAVDAILRGTTSTKNETLMPVWNQSITDGTSLTTTVLTTSGRWTVSVYDSDGSTDDVACSVAGKLTAADLTAGTVTYSDKQNCVSLTLKVACAQN